MLTQSHTLSIKQQPQHTHKLCSPRRLGLQTPAPPGAPCVRALPKAPPKREGAIWASVKIIKEHPTSPQLQCLNCGATFCGGATRIREHVTGDGVSITACACESDSFLDMKQKLIEKAEVKEGAKKQKVAEAAVDAAADAPVLPVKEEKVKLQQQSIQAAVKSATGAACDEAIAEFFYGCNIPPSVAARPPAVEEDGRHAEDRASDIQAARSESPWW